MNDVRLASVILIETTQLPSIHFFGSCFFISTENLRRCKTETVDALLDITHEKPIPLFDSFDDRVLDRVDVLKFVHKNHFVTVLDAFPDLFIFQYLGGELKLICKSNPFVEMFLSSEFLFKSLCELEQQGNDPARIIPVFFYILKK